MGLWEEEFLCHEKAVVILKVKKKEYICIIGSQVLKIIYLVISVEKKNWKDNMKTLSVIFLYVDCCIFPVFTMNLYCFYNRRKKSMLREKKKKGKINILSMYKKTKILKGTACTKPSKGLTFGQEFLC